MFRIIKWDIPNSNIKIVERVKVDTFNTQIHDRSLPWLGTHTSLNGGGVKLLLCPPPPLKYKYKVKQKCTSTKWSMCISVINDRLSPLNMVKSRTIDKSTNSNHNKRVDISNSYKRWRRNCIRSPTPCLIPFIPVLYNDATNMIHGGHDIIYTK